MKPINLVLRANALHPDRKADIDELNSRFGEGEVITTDLKPSVDRTGNARFWAIIQKAYKTAGAGEWKSDDAFADAVKIAAGHCELTQTLRGKPYFKTRSLSEIKDWDTFIDKVIAKLVDILAMDERLLREVPESASKETKREDVSYTPKECMEKFLELGMSMDWPGAAKAHHKVVEDRIRDWLKALPTHAEFVEECGKAAHDLVEADVFPDKARKRLEALLKVQ